MCSPETCALTSSRPSWLPFGRTLGGFAAAATALILTLSAPEAQAQPPANDDQAAAEVLDGTQVSGLVPGNNQFAGFEIGEPSHGVAGTPNQSVWYSFQPDTGGLYSFEVKNTGMDSVLAIYDSSSVAAPGLATNNDINPPSNLRSRFAVNLTTGTQYLLAVDVASGVGEEFELEWDLCDDGPLSTTVFLSQTTGTVGSDQFAVQWQPVVGAEGYRIRLNGVDEPSTPDTLTTVTLRVGINVIEVWAYNSCGEGSRETATVVYCPVGTVTYRGPMDGQTLGTSDDIFLRWGPVPGAVGYAVLIDGVTITTSDTQVRLRDVITANPFQPLDEGVHSWGVRAIFDSPVCNTPPNPDRTYSICNRPDVQVALDLVNGAQIDCGSTVALNFRVLTTATITINSLDVYLNGNLVQSSLDNSYTTTGLEAGTYNWYVVANVDPVSSCSQYFSPVQSFCIKTGITYLFPPPDSVQPCSLDELRWAFNCPTTQARVGVYIDGSLVATTTGTSYRLPAPLSSGGHDWIVLFEEECGPTGQTLPNRFCLQDPATSITATFPAINSNLTTHPAYLEWSPLCGALDYAVFLNGVLVGTTSDTSITVDLLANPSLVINEGQNLWRVRPVGTCGDPGLSPEFQFDVCSAPPTAPVLAFPLEGQVVNSLGLSFFSWDPVPSAQEYRVFVDGTLLTTTTLPFAEIGPNTCETHTWQVEVITACGSERSAVRSFCVLDPVTVSYPADQTTTHCAISELAWEPVCGATSYSVELDGNPIGDTTGTRIALPSALAPGSHEFVVVAHSACGSVTSINDGLPFRFCVRDDPSAVTAVFPALNAVLSTGPAVLEWSPVCGALSYSVQLNGTPLGVTTDTVLSVPDGVAVSGSNTWEVAITTVCGAPATTVPVFEFCVAEPPAITNLPTTGTEVYCGNPLLVEYTLPAGVTTATLFLDPLGSFEIDDSGSTTVEGLDLGCYTVRIESETSCGLTATESVAVTVLPRLHIIAPSSTLAEVPPPVFCGPQTLRWQVNCSAPETTYSVFLNGILQGQTTGTEFFLGNFTAGAYDVEVVAEPICGVSVDSRLRLCVLNAPSVAVFPSDGAVLTSEPTVLEWSGCLPNNATYLVTLNGDLFAVTTATQVTIETTRTLVGLNEWQVQVLSGCASRLSQVFTYTYDDFVCPAPPVLSLPTSGTIVACDIGMVVEYGLPVGSTTGTLRIGSVLSLPLDNSGSLLVSSVPVGCHLVTVESETTCGLLVSEPVRIEVYSNIRITGPGNPAGDPPTPLACGPATLTWEADCIDPLGTTYTILLNGLQIGQTTETQFFLGDLGPGIYATEIQVPENCGGVSSFGYTFCVAARANAAVDPPSAATVTTEPTVLVWEGCFGPETTSTVILNGTLVGETTGTSIAVDPSLTLVGSNTWTVTVQSPCGGSRLSRFTYFFDTSGCPRPDPVLALFPPDDPVTPIPCTTDLLIWETPTSGVPATSYSVFVDGILQAVTTDTQYQIPAPLAGGPHTWSIVPVNSCGTGTTATFSFCLQDIPQLIFPTPDSIIDCTSTLDIRWDGGCGDGTFDVYLDGGLIGQTTGTSLAYTAGLANGPHTVQIVMTGACGVTSTDVINFCIQGTPINVAPANRTVFPAALPTELEWLDACGATSYSVILNGVEIGQTADTTFPISLTPGTGPFEWQIVAYGDCGETTGPRWIFTDCAGVAPPNGPVPFDGETTAAGLPTELRWNPVIGATSYQVNINGSFVTTVFTNSYTLPLVLPELSYTWQIIATVPGCGTVPGPVWNFTVCTLAPAPIPLTPQAGETTRPENIQFDWTDVSGTISYRMQLDNFITGDLFTSDFQFGFGIAPGIRQWAPVSRTSCGFTTAPLTTFCVLDWAIVPDPPDGALLCASPTLFSWNPVLGATHYDLIVDGVVVATSVTLSEAPFSGTLSEGLHSWQVITYNECGQMPSEVWTFEIGQTGIPSPLSWQTDGVVHALATDGTRIYIGGEFENLVSPSGALVVPRRNIAAVDLATGQPSNWVPGTDGPVFALAVGGGRVYAGGDFTTFGNASQLRVGSVASAGGTATPFVSTIAANAPVRALALSPDNQTLYLGGDFNRIGTTVRRYLAAVNTATGNLDGFNPDPNNRVRVIYPDSSGDIYVGGIFTEVASTTRRGIARLTTAGSLTPWNANCDLYVYSIKRGAGGLYVGGFFSTLGGSPRTNLALLDPNTATALSWNPQINGTVVAVEPSGADVFVAGLFSQIGTANRPYLARVSGTTAQANDCGYDPDYPVRTVLEINNTVWVGGEFTLVSGQPIRGLAGFGQITEPPNQAGGWELYE